MAILIRGKMKGQRVKLLQWCNNWFMVEPGGPVSPSSLQLDSFEIEKVLESKNNGLLFMLYELTEMGTFKKRKRS